MLGDVDRALLAPTRVPGLDEIGDMRVKAMDEAGIAVQVLSHTKPGVQEIEDAGQALQAARGMHAKLRVEGDGDAIARASLDFGHFRPSALRFLRA